MKENDICSWRWKDEKIGHIGDPYHCKARKGIVHNGQLLDLFWMNIGSHFSQAGWSQSRSGGRALNLDLINFEVIANIDDLTEIRRGNERYYKPEDIVDLDHPNTSHAPIFVRKGAELDVATMREYVNEKIAQAKDRMASAQSDLDWWQAKAEQVDAGDIENVYL